MSERKVRTRAVSPRSWLATVAIYSALAGACGGMDKLNDLNENGIPDDQEQLPDEDDTSDEESWDGVQLVEECPDLCAAAIAEMGDTPGCELFCDIDILPSFAGVAVTNVAVLLTAAAAGDFEAGQSCELVTVCETPCGTMLGDCMEAVPEPPDPALLGLCTEEYRECLIEEDCFASRVTCEEGAIALLEACVDAGDPLEECEEVFEDAMCMCGTIYNMCVGTNEEACPDEEALALISPPMQTAPGRFRVTRAFIDSQLERLSAMSTEIFVLPVFNPSGKPIGFELRSIRSDDPIHALGLRNRDVLLAVNDTPVVQGRVAEDLLNLYKVSQLRLTIRRGGMTRQLTYDIVQK